MPAISSEKHLNFKINNEGDHAELIKVARAFASDERLKILKYIVKTGFSFSGVELMTLGVATVTAFIVSVVAIKFLMSFVRRHSFESFGWYRIVLGVLVLGSYFIFR